MNSALGIVYILIAVLSVVAFVNAKGIRLFQFPFLFSSVWIVFVLLSFAEIIRYGEDLFRIYDDLGVIDLTLYLLISSIIAGFLGYLMVGGGTPQGAMQKTPLSVSPRFLARMHKASIIVAVMSYGAFFMLAQLGGGLRSYIFYSGAYTITWEGLPVYLVFVVRFGYVSIVIQLWLWSRTKKTLHLALALLFSIIPFINIFFIFRRSEVMTMGVYFGYFIANYTRITIGRIHTIGAVGAMYLVLFLFPLLRNEESKNQSFGVLLDQAFARRETFENSEMGAGLFRIYHAMTNSAFEYGTIFWNAFVNQFLPSGLIGSDLKSALLFAQTNLADTSFAGTRFYLSPMGFAQAYQQFWLFAGVIFLVIAVLIGRMEQRRYESPRHEIFFVLMIPPLLSSISADLSLLVSRSITFGVLALICIPKLRPEDVRFFAGNDVTPRFSGQTKEAAP